MVNNFGFNANSLPIGYGAQAAYGTAPNPMIGFGGGGFTGPIGGFGGFGGFGGGAFPAFGNDWFGSGGGAFTNDPMAMMYASMPEDAMGFGAAYAPERFVTSEAGGVILDSSGNPSGRVPRGSFLDSQTGTIYGTDGKEIPIPSGSTVDFFDLPDVGVLRSEFAVATGGGTETSSGTTIPGGTGKGWDPSHVAGQWGPGGVSDLKGGGATTQMPGCDHDHGTSVGGMSGPGGKGPVGKGSAVAGASGGGADASPFASPLASALGSLAPVIAQLQSMLQAQLTNAAGGGKASFGLPVSSVAGASGGGGATQAASGAGGLGATPSLEQSLAELVSVLKQLATELQQMNSATTSAPPAATTTMTTTSGGGAAGAPGKGATTPPSTESSDSSSSSDTTATTTAD